MIQRFHWLSGNNHLVDEMPEYTDIGFEPRGSIIGAGEFNIPAELRARYELGVDQLTIEETKRIASAIHNVWQAEYRAAIGRGASPSLAFYDTEAHGVLSPTDPHKGSRPPDGMGWQRIEAVKAEYGQRISESDAVAIAVHEFRERSRPFWERLFPPRSFPRSYIAAGLSTIERYSPDPVQIEPQVERYNRDVAWLTEVVGALYIHLYLGEINPSTGRRDPTRRDADVRTGVGSKAFENAIKSAVGKCRSGIKGPRWPLPVGKLCVYYDGRTLDGNGQVKPLVEVGRTLRVLTMLSENGVEDVLFWWHWAQGVGPEEFETTAKPVLAEAIALHRSGKTGFEPEFLDPVT